MCDMRMDVFLLNNTCKIPVVKNIQSFCSTFPSHFVFTFLASHSSPEKSSSEVVWLARKVKTK